MKLKEIEKNMVIHCNTEEEAKELTAEEVIKLQAEICHQSICLDCPIQHKLEENITCNNFRREHPDKVLEILKQYKKDHSLPPKEPEVEWVYHVLAYDFEGIEPNEMKELYYKTEQEAIDKAEELTKKYIDNSATFCIDKVCRVKEI